MTGIVQPVVYILDGSGSMTWEGKSGRSKAEEVKEALLYMIKYFKGEIPDPNRSEEKIEQIAKRIYVNFVVFSQDAKPILDDFQNIKSIEEGLIKPPTEYIEPDGTNIYRGLEVAKEISGRYISKLEQDGIRTIQPTFILLSDGCHTHYPPEIPQKPEDVISLSEEIRASGIYISVVQYGEPGKDHDGFPDACPDILKQIASELDAYLLDRINRRISGNKNLFKENRLFVETVDIDTLKIFFIGSTLIRSLK